MVDSTSRTEENHPKQQEIDSLIKLYQSNRLAEAELACNKVLRSYPKSLEVLNLLGVTLQAQNKAQQAINIFNRMIELKPDNPIPYSNRALAQKALGAVEDALESYGSAIALDPGFEQAYINRSVVLQDLNRLEESLSNLDQAIGLNASNFKSHYNRGNVLRDLHRLEEARSSYKQAIALAPHFAEAHCNLGSVLTDFSNHEEALISYKKAVEIQPVFPQVHFSIGNLLKHAGDLEGALESYEIAVNQNPEFAEAYCNKGVVLEELGHTEESIDCYNQALRVNSNYPEAYSNRGVAFHELSRLKEALSNFDQAIQLKPSYTQAYYNKANVLRDLGQLHQSLENHKKAIVLDPHFSEAFNNKGNVLQDLGRLDEAVVAYKKAIQLSPKYRLAHTSFLMMMSYMPQLESEGIYQLARKYGELESQGVESRITDYMCEISPDKLRVGIVSGDLHSHPVGYFLEGFLSELNIEKVEVFAYSNSQYEDQLTERIRPLFSKWSPIYGLDDKKAADLINSDGVHILIDLSGHTQNHRLPVFCYKPAPVQITWLGYFATTGIAEIDYLLGDPYVTPEDTQEKFSESVWRLSNSRWCATIPEYKIEVAPLPAKENGFITFGSFGNYTKVNDEVIDLWCQLLTLVPTSRLVLKAKQFRDERVVDEVTSRFSSRGIEVERIIIEEPEEREKYFEAYNRIDITLDTFPFTGGTTTVDSLWMGVPVVSLEGGSLVSRQGVGVLMNTGLSNWIGSDKTDYLEIAIGFAQDISGLAELRKGLREQVVNSPLFDARTFAAHWTQAMWEMWEMCEMWESHQDSSSN